MQRRKGYNEESKLMDSLRKGDISAFDAIFYQYSKQIFSYLAKSSLTREDAEEITNDVFMSLWKMRHSLDSTQSLTSLLFAIAYRKRVDAFRREINSPIYENFINLHNELRSEETSHIESKEFFRILKSALDSLPERKRTIIVLSHFKGVSPAEIADRLKITEKTVRNYLSEGISELKEIITRKLKS